MGHQAHPAKGRTRRVLAETSVVIQDVLTSKRKADEKDISTYMPPRRRKCFWTMTIVARNWVSTALFGALVGHILTSRQRPKIDPFLTPRVDEHMLSRWRL